MPDLRAFLACFHHGHVPGDRDWVGRPMACARCGRDAAEMTLPERERFYGRAASEDWNAEAVRQIEVGTLGGAWRCVPGACAPTGRPEYVGHWSNAANAWSWTCPHGRPYFGRTDGPWEPVYAAGELAVRLETREGIGG